MLIESVSHFSRPFTLSIPLEANMMPGHLVIALLTRIRLINVYRVFFIDDTAKSVNGFIILC